MVSVSDNLVPPAVEVARKWLKRDRDEQAQRDLQIRRLDNAYDAGLSNLDSGGKEGYTLTTTLKDPSATAGQGSNPRFSEVPVAMVRAITEDWKSIMAITPNYLCPPTRPGEDASEREADRREEIVAGIYWDSAIDFCVQQGAHYRSLHGAELLYALPDPEDKRVRIETRSPYRSYARLLSARRDLMYMGWDWEDYTDSVLAQWPGLEQHLTEQHGVYRNGRIVKFPDMLTMTEWYDRTNRIVMAKDVWVPDMPWVEHNWGFVPGQVVPNILGVGLWGQPDVLHAVHLSQLTSELLSMLLDGVFQGVYDPAIIFDDNPIGTVNLGPHEVLQLSRNARTGSLRQNVKLPEGSLILDMMERMARLASGWPKVQSSEMDSPIISGKAFVAAQGPVAARAAVKMQVAGRSLERVTGYAMRLYEHHFPKQAITLTTIPSGVRNSVVADRGAVGGLFTFVPETDIAGNYVVVCNYPPGGADQYRSTIEQLQLMEAEVISVETVRQNRPGINAKAEEMRVQRQKMQKAQADAQMATMMAQAQLQLQQSMMAPPAEVGSAPSPGPSAPVPPGVPSEGAGPTLAMEPAGAPARREAVAGARETQGRWERVTRQEVRAEMAAVRPIRGRVFLLGAVARMGWTTGMIEIGLTDMIDKATITQKTRFGREGRLVFQEVPADQMPQENAVLEITPAG